MQSIQTEAMDTPKNAESTTSSENATENMRISSDLSREGTIFMSNSCKNTDQQHFFLCFISAAVACKPPVTEVEKVDQNLAARLLNYDVDKATEHIQSQLDELMKEMECDMEDVENADDDDIE